MTRYIVALSILFTALSATARVPSDTRLGLAGAVQSAQVVTCQIDGFSNQAGGAQSSVLVDVEALSVEDAFRQSISTHSAGALNLQGDVHMLKVEMGNGKAIWAKSIACDGQVMQVADCCRTVCGTCKQ